MARFNYIEESLNNFVTKENYEDDRKILNEEIKYVNTSLEDKYITTSVIERKFE